MPNYSKFGGFLNEIEQLFKQHYGLSMIDVGYDDEDYLEMFEMNDTPKDIVKEYADKHDLDNINVVLVPKAI